MNNSVFRLMSDSCTSNPRAAFGGKRRKVGCLLLPRRAARCSVTARRCGSAIRAEPYGTNAAVLALQRRTWPHTRVAGSAAPRARQGVSTPGAAAGAPPEHSARAERRSEWSQHVPGAAALPPPLFQPPAQSAPSPFSPSQTIGQERSDSPVSAAAGTRQSASAQPALAVTVRNQINS